MTEEALYQAMRTISRDVRVMLTSDIAEIRERGWRLVAAAVAAKLA